MVMKTSVMGSESTAGRDNLGISFSALRYLFSFYLSCTGCVEAEKDSDNTGFLRIDLGTPYDLPPG